MKRTNIAILPCTNALWHEFWSGYVADPMMSNIEHIYGYDICEKIYWDKMADVTRRYFLIVCDEKVIGYIYLKHIDLDKKSSEFGVALIDDSVKGKGYGTEAIKLLVEYAFDEMGLETIVASSVLRNTRSQHVLANLGFVYTHSDCKFMWYKLEREM